MAKVKLFIGQAMPFGPNGELSAIQKKGVTHEIALTMTGFSGDEQGDKRYHGGLNKALHHYPEEHYAIWRNTFSLNQSLFNAGGFGENISTNGLDETTVCIGDIYQIGSAVIQVSQGRQPCWKLNVRFNVPNMASVVQKTALTGWYYRVLQSGWVTPSSTLQLVERPCSAWPLSELSNYLYIDTLNTKKLTEMASLSYLPDSWRDLVIKRLISGAVENWNHRLTTLSTAQI